MLGEVLQATARDVFASFIPIIEYELGLPILFHVHDELTCLVPEDKAEDALRDLLQVMRTPPDFMPGLPLDAEGKSRWGGDKFTSASSLAAKLDAIASRGAAAILVAEPPGYAGKKANLAAMSADSLGGALDIPCFFVNAEAADAIWDAVVRIRKGA